MIKRGLATIGRKLRRPIYRGVSPALIVISLSMVADGVFWYLGLDGAAQIQSAFIQLATAWTVAVMTLVAGLFLSARSEAISSRNISRNKQRAAYEEFISKSDELDAIGAEFAMAKSAYDVARSKLDAANKQASLIGNETNLKARLVAFAEFTKAEVDFSSVEATAQDLQEAYRAAETAAARIVTPPVRPAFDEFRKCPSENTLARASARSRFVQAAQSDLRVPVDQPAERVT